jgi:hypothetical protein
VYGRRRRRAAGAAAGSGAAAAAGAGMPVAAVLTQLTDMVRASTSSAGSAQPSAPQQDAS